MNINDLADQLFHRQRAETQSVLTDATTHTYLGTATSDSADGMVSVTLGGYETLPEDGGETQGYGSVQFPCGPNVRKGDSVVVSAVGGGVMRSPMVVSSSGSGDRQQAEIDGVTKFVTEVTDDGVMVHPEGDSTTGWHISDALDLLLSGVSMFRVWLDNAAAKVRIGSEVSNHIVLTDSAVDFCGVYSSTDPDTEYTYAQLDGDSSGNVSLYTGDFVSYTWGAGLYTTSNNGTYKSRLESHKYAGAYQTKSASIGAVSSTSASYVTMDGDELHAGSDVADMANVGRLIGCRIDVASGSITTAAGSGASVTLTWESGGFEDANYLVSITPYGMESGFNNVAYCVTARTTTTVTIGSWNSGGASVTQTIGVLAVDSRYGS